MCISYLCIIHDFLYSFHMYVYHFIFKCIYNHDNIIYISYNIYIYSI